MLNIRYVPTVGRASAFMACRWLLFASAYLLLGACATHGGYPNHVTAQNIIEPEKAKHDSPDMYLDLIRQMQKQGAYYASLAHIDAYRQRNGNPPELQRLRADALREIGQTDGASKAYRRLLDTDQSAAAWHGLGLIDADAGRYDQAAQSLRKAVELEPINAAYLGDLGYAQLCAGQLALAREPLAKAAELEPASIKAISNLALWATLHGDRAQADAIMQRADLPQSARDAVQKLATRLRTGTQAQTGLPNAPRTDIETAAAPSIRVMPRRVPPPQIAGIPGGMLERFGTSTPTSEARP